jgi:PAS domain S-box-containing protein
MPVLPLSRRQSYVIAVSGVLATAFLRAWLDPFLGSDLPLFFFIVPVVLAGWYGGLSAGLLATILSLLLGDLLFISPRGSILRRATLLDMERLLGFAVTGTLLSILCGKVREAFKCMTEHKLAVETMRRREHFARNIIDVSPSLIYIFDIEHQKYVFLSRAAAEVLSYAESQVREAGFVSTVMDPADWNLFLDHLRRLNGLQADESADFEYRMRHRNGTWRWFHSRDKVLTRNADCTVREIIGTTTDITERKNAERKSKFLVGLDQALAPIADPEHTMTVAMCMLGEYLGADRTGYAEVETDGDHFAVMGEYTQGATPHMSGRRRISEFGEQTRQLLQQGRPYVVDSVEAESAQGTDLSPYRRAEIRAMVWIPLIKDRKFVAKVSVDQSTPRHWLDEEIDLITAVANRCWESLERVGALKHLKESEDRYRAFIANSTEGIWRYELDEPVPVTLPPDQQIELIYHRGYLAECNEVFAHSHGYSSVDEILGQRLTVLFVRSEAEKIINYSRLFVRSGYRLIGIETREVDIHDTTKYFVSNLIGIQENGKLVRAWGTQRDITAQKHAEQALLSSEERFAKAFRASPDALVLSRLADGVILEVNDSFVELSGYDRDELIGKSTLSLDLYVDPTVRERALKILKAEGRIRDLKVEVKRKSGEVRLIQFSAEPIDVRGDQCWVTLGKDITERERAEKEREQLLEKEKAAREEAERSNRTKDEFLAMISHELRTPLTAIRGWIHMLVKGTIPHPQMQHAFEVIERSTESQARLVDDILDMSRIITGRINLEASTIDTAPILHAAVDVVRPGAQAKGITLQVDSDAPAMILADANRIQQILWNLLSNAVKFTNPGGRVDARLMRTEDRVEISISDTGIGIEPEFLPHVFDRFQQADSSSTRRYGGLGLGLAIVRYLVEVQGGTVSASSLGKGQGATFKVSFPAVDIRRSEQRFPLRRVR